MAERRGGDKKDEGPARRVRRQTEAPEQEQESEKEDKVPEQTLYGNSFLVGAMGNQHGGADGDGGGVELDAMQDFGGIEDADPVAEAPTPEGHWFQPRFRRKGGEEFDPTGDEGPEDPGVPPEDGDWIDALDATGSPWTDPCPQPIPRVFDGAIAPWLRALLPIATDVPSQLAVATGLVGDPGLQDPHGRPLLGVACAAALGTSIARIAVDTEPGRVRVQRGLALAAAPQAPRDAARTAADLAGLPAPTRLPASKPDPWLARLVLARLGLDKPPVPLLDDPPPPAAPEPDQPVDFDALLDAELGPPPDPAVALRSMAVEACEAQAVWAVGLRSGAASCALVLAECGVEPGVVSACLANADGTVAQAISLLQEIAAAARGHRVPVRGLRNGLARSAQILLTAHRQVVEGLAAAGAIPVLAAARPPPTHPELVASIQDGRVLPDLGVEPLPLELAYRAAFSALEAGHYDEVVARAGSLRNSAWDRQDGVGVAAATLLEVEAHHLSGASDAAERVRSEVGARLKGAGARSGVSLLARWLPRTGDPDPVQPG